MPSLGADMEEGTLVEWRVKPGDTVKHGDIIALVHTEKAEIEVEVFESGVVESLLAKPGAKLPVGSVLALIKGEADKAAVPAPALRKQPVASTPSKTANSEAAPTPEASPARKTSRVRVSPLARKLAKDLGVDLGTVQGTGPNGAIDSEDVERTAKAAKAPPASEVATPIVEPAPKPTTAIAEAYFGMRRAIAAAMSRSNREIPHYYLQTRVDVSQALHWMEEENRRRPLETRLLPVALLLRAVVLALKDVPDLNGYWKDDRLQISEPIHLGFAISLRQGGLIVPAILNAEEKSLDEIMAAMSDLIQRTRAGRLRSSEITDGTITVTNLGDRGVETVFGVIYPPQVALIGLGKIIEQPWAHDGGLVVRPVLTVSLAGDHRATDGRRGAQFLESFTNWLHGPEKL
jgi:pyruvate dehydrogenase E2 component (dihydrolipoamide acetyltransferase)